MLIVQTDKYTYSPEETVLITLTWRNSSNTPQEVTFTSAQRFDVSVERAGHVVWQWSRGKYFAQVLTSLVIAPGDARVFKVEWKQKGEDGHPLLPGFYDLRAWVLGTNDQGETRISLA